MLFRSLVRKGYEEIGLAKFISDNFAEFSGKFDRFARNRYDSAHYEYQLERNHVKLVSATEPISDSPAGIMVKSMLTGMAEYYSAELSEKVVRGMTENVLKGKYNGGTIPIGFKVDEEKFFQVDPLKAPFVVEALQRYNDGATMKELRFTFSLAFVTLLLSK